MKKAQSKSEIVRNEIKRISKKLRVEERATEDNYELRLTLDPDTWEVVRWAACARQQLAEQFARDAIKDAAQKALKNWHLMMVPPEEFLAAMHLLAEHHYLEEKEPTPALKKAFRRWKKVLTKHRKR